MRLHVPSKADLSHLWVKAPRHGTVPTGTQRRLLSDFIRRVFMAG